MLTEEANMLTIPSTLPIYRLNASQYHKITETNIIETDSRYELIEGLIYKMMPVGPKHVYIVKKIETILENCLKEKAVVFTQSPLKLSENNEPQPDVLVVKPPLERYQERLPTKDDVLLLIEVAHSTLVFDRSIKANIYAALGILEYWIINLQEMQIEVYRNPLPEKKLYQEIFVVKLGVKISPLAFPDCEVQL